jgi:hypothetical protein
LHNFDCSDREVKNNAELHFGHRVLYCLFAFLVSPKKRQILEKLCIFLRTIQIEFQNIETKKGDFTKKRTKKPGESSLYGKKKAESEPDTTTAEEPLEFLFETSQYYSEGSSAAEDDTAIETSGPFAHLLYSRLHDLITEIHKHEDFSKYLDEALGYFRVSLTTEETLGDPFNTTAWENLKVILQITRSFLADYQIISTFLNWTLD